MKVSILVLVEGTLQLADVKKNKELVRKVSILVLVEGTLQPSGTSTTRSGDKRFNPCFSGRYSATSGQEDRSGSKTVSILVLVEGTLQL